MIQRTWTSASACSVRVVDSETDQMVHCDVIFNADRFQTTWDGGPEWTLIYGRTTIDCVAREVLDCVLFRYYEGKEKYQRTLGGTKAIETHYWCGPDPEVPIDKGKGFADVPWRHVREGIPSDGEIYITDDGRLVKIAKIWNYV